MTLFTSIAEFIACNEHAPRRGADALTQAVARARSDNALMRIYTCLDPPDPGLPSPAPAPLRGVPIAIKDNIDVAGTPTSCGRCFTEQFAVADAAIVARLRLLGACIIGKTNMDEAALGASGRNHRFGRCHNPRFSDRLSGGSSGGSAAAVAAGQVLLGVGTDTLGSVRIPAAFCGIAGFKPTHGVLPMTGVAPLYPRLDSVGLLANSLADLARVAALLLPPAPRPTGAWDPSLRLGVLAGAALTDAEPSVAEDYRHCLRSLQRVPECLMSPAPPIDWCATASAALWEVAHDFAQRSAAGSPGYRALDDIVGDLGRLLARAASLPAARLEAGRELIKDSGAKLRRSLIEADALLTPTCPENAPLADRDPAKQVAAFTTPANLAGLPAVAWTQRLGKDRTLSLQLIGRAGEDLRLLALAERVQQMIAGDA